MKQDFFGILPPEITIEILSRLPVRTTVTCKCVCKPWLDLVKTPEFSKSHISKSSPGLAVFQDRFPSEPYAILEYVDDHKPVIEQRFSNLVNFNFPHPKFIHSSVDGLLLLHGTKKRPHNLFICNPITRDYIKIPCLQKYSSSKRRTRFNIFGFGVSKTTGLYKVVRIYHKCFQPKCQVYTLGTGSWRGIEPGGPLLYACNTGGALLNGNLHWLAWDMDHSPLISCFDIEAEHFSIFSSPRLEGDRHYKALSVLGECLCLCDNSADDQIVIWLMNEYGDLKSWTKQFVIYKYHGAISPIKVFKDGGMLIGREGWSGICCYSSKTKTIRETNLIDSYNFGNINAVSYTPSFLPLKTFATENVSSF